MSAVLWAVEHIHVVLAGAALWTAVAVVIALLIGASIRRAELEDSRG